MFDLLDLYTKGMTLEVRKEGRKKVNSWSFFCRASTKIRLGDITPFIGRKYAFPKKKIHSGRYYRPWTLLSPWDVVSPRTFIIQGDIINENWSRSGRYYRSETHTFALWTLLSDWKLKIITFSPSGPKLNSKECHSTQISYIC